MLIRRILALCCGLLGGVAAAWAQGAPDTTISTPSPPVETSGTPYAAPTSSASVANPATSVTGWIQAVSGNDHTMREWAFALREAELGFQAAVDPFSRADCRRAVSEENHRNDMGQRGRDTRHGRNAVQFPGRGAADLRYARP